MNASIHFGQWLWWKIKENYHGDKHRAERELERSWQTIRAYCRQETPAGIPATALVDMEMAMKLPRSSIWTAYLKEPAPPVPADPRGRKADEGPRMWRMRLVIPRELADRMTAIAGVDGISMDDAITQACEDWAAAKRGSAPVIERPAKPPLKPKGRKARGGATGPGEKGLTSPA